MFYITISNGLIKGDHRKKMGEAVWEFMWCIDRVTKIDDEGFGWVLGGKPINLSEPANDMEVHEVTVSRNLTKVEEKGYIKKFLTPNGIRILVSKAKQGFNRNVKPALTDMLNPVSESVKPLSIQLQRHNSKTGVEFEKFWSVYPKKVEKKKAELKWNKINKTTQELILSDLPRRSKTEQWQKNNGQFVPNPTTYLNGERWNDQIENKPYSEVKYSVWKPPIEDRADINSASRQKFDAMKEKFKIGK